MNKAIDQWDKDEEQDKLEGELKKMMKQILIATGSTLSKEKMDNIIETTAANLTASL
jgi:hypothetical protein